MIHEGWECRPSSGTSASTGSRPEVLAVGRHRFSQDCKDLSIRKGAVGLRALDAPWDDALGFFRVSWTEVSNLCRLELCQGVLSPECSVRIRNEAGRRHTRVMYVLSDCRGRVGRVELREGLHVFKRFVVDPKSGCKQTKEKMTRGSVRRVWCILFPVFQKVFHL